MMAGFGTRTLVRNKRSAAFRRRVPTYHLKLSSPMLAIQGYEIHRSIFSLPEIHELRTEADRIAQLAESTCVRNISFLSEIFQDLTRSPRLFALLPTPTLIPVRSILFDKTQKENWPVAWHQDLTIATRSKEECMGYGPWSVKDGIPHAHAPVSLLEQMATLRIHLDPTDCENEALLVAPGTHQLGKIAHDSIPDLVRNSTETCECAPGDVLLMPPLILHSSKRSKNPNRRRILHFEYAPPDALDPRLTWHESLSSQEPLLSGLRHR